MNFIYHNKKTENFIDFEVLEISDDLSPDDAIDAFMKIVKDFNDDSGVMLPMELKKLLSDSEFDLFFLAAYSDEYMKAIEDMIYVVKDDDFVVDQHGVKYNLDYVGKKESIITLDTVTGLAVFTIPNDKMVNNKIDFSSL